MKDRENALNQLYDAIEDLEVSKNAKVVLARLAQAPDGILRDSAPNIVAPMVFETAVVANQVLIELGARHLITDEEVDGQVWIKANYPKFGISAAVRKKILSPLSRFTEIGPPHSTVGMESLAKFFESPSDIYLILSVTSYDVFSALQERAESGKKTVFIFPSRKHVTGQLNEHYTEVLNGWVRFLKNGTAKLRENTHLLISTADFSDIQTCGLSSEEARININDCNSTTTREGTIIRVESTSTLYSIFKARISAVYQSARPLIRLAPIGYSLYFARKAAWPIGLAVVGIGLAFLTNIVAGVFSTIAVGLLRIWIADAIQVKSWNKKELFQR